GRGAGTDPARRGVPAAAVGPAARQGHGLGGRGDHPAGAGRAALRHRPPALPSDPVRIGSLSFSEDRIWFAALVAAIAVVLWAYGRYTRAGLATRAAAESERGAILLGWAL